MTADLLSIQNLNVHFGRSHVVRDVSLRLAPSEKLAIIGESGSGKSVTAMSVMRLLDGQARTTGSIRLCGDDILSLTPRAMQALRGSRVAMVFQDPMTSLNPTFTIGRQLRDVLRAHRIATPGGPATHAAGLLVQVGIHDPARCLKLYPHELSGGMRQRVMIALAIACDPKLLIADEPTTALDVTVQEQITRLLVSLCDNRGIGLVFISHNLDLVGEFADRIMVMYRGEVVEDGPARQVMGAPRADYTRRLLAAIPRIRADAAPPTAGETVLEARQVARRYPLARSALARMVDRRETTALAPTYVAVGRQEVLGIVGESGSGKSTLARLLVGLDRPSAGAVLLDGRDLHQMVAQDRAALSRRLQLVFQGSQTSLNPRKTIRRALTEAMAAARMPDSHAPSDLMRLVRLDPALLDRYPYQLSGGQRQRVCIARALSTRPEILIADEPTSALDVSIQKDIIELLQTLQRDLGMTMVIISHDLGLVGTICHRVVVMRAGEIVEQGAAGAVLTNPQIPYTRSLIEAIPRGLAGRGRFSPSAPGA
ncbi:ABC transporter ATP-binding protein [Gemmobacter sp.]|uniref:ABC transporter ATP-binding protein n=1 Tax=Gemmobacter sp. TaxID=1898957 RepID=UPI002AFF3C99|nr:ABC transporter ATP-binding protein [Gemmobacter sp.]